ncbi:MAG: InlB B-repeat-containing protein, partial [Bacillota bacterium]|nr:InlB B-repeat-containing protein [Bacillota bacterium]
MFKTTIRLTLTILFTLCLMSCDQGGTFYDITFHENGGAAVEPVEVAGKDAAGIVLPEPTREHYAFAGWFIDDGTFESEWIPVILEGDLDLYAKWIPTDYLVRFDTRCDLAIQDVVVPLDGQLTLPTPERAGWTFIGWFTGNTLDTIMVGGTYSPTDSVTLKAFWFADTYEITIHWWEDVEPSSFTLSFENIFDDFREPMRPGLEVEGLYLDEARTILFDAMTLPQTTNVLVLYAKYVPTRGVEVAVIAEHPDLSQSAYAQPVWDATAAICEDNGLTYALYLPIEASTSGYLAAITTAIEAGARLVLLPGYLFEPAAGIAQIIFPDITFVVIDGTPVNAQYMPHVLENAVALGFKEEELGFLAGYAAVREGHRNLGFLGGMAVPPVVRYGIGFVAGAYYAADELGVSITFAPEHYAYAGTFGPSLEIRNMA